MTIASSIELAPRRFRIHLTAIISGCILLAGAAPVPGIATAQSSPGELSRTLELRGYTEAAGEYAFSIYNRETGRGHWLWLNEPSDGYLVTNFDPERRTVEIRYNNQTATISLQRSRILEYFPDISPAPGYEPSTLPPGQTASANGPRGSGSPGAGRGAQGQESTQDGGRSSEGPAGESSPLNGGIPFGGGTIPTPPDSPDEADEGDPDDSDGLNDPGLPPPLPPTPPPGYTPER